MNIIGTYKTQHGELTIAQNGVNIIATYQNDGVCSGKLTDNKVEGIWKNKNDQGLFEWTFDGNGSFTGKYKSGLETGPMKGRWHGKHESLINNQSDTIQFSFDVVQENGGKIEYQFNKDFKNLSFQLSENEIIVDDYHNIIMEKDLLEYCSNHIKTQDPYLMENADNYSLRVTRINDYDLSFLWKVESLTETDIQALKKFFPNKQAEINTENYGDIILEFRSDYICSLSYVKTF
ncbi:MAG: hypothetical protein WCP57_11100 [Bacteroidota bacterium]|jgi:hypothetical protein